MFVGFDVNCEYSSRLCLAIPRKFAVKDARGRRAIRAADAGPVPAIGPPFRSLKWSIERAWEEPSVRALRDAKSGYWRLRVFHLYTNPPRIDRNSRPPRHVCPHGQAET